MLRILSYKFFYRVYPLGICFTGFVQFEINGPAQNRTGVSSTSRKRLSHWTTGPFFNNNFLFNKLYIQYFIILSMFSKRGSKKGQITIFLILAILLIAGIGGYFLLKNRLSSSEIPANLEPVYTTFLQCFENDVLTGIDVLESQGGYIELPDFEVGSAYMPFGSQLYFFGNPIPYWYYVSGNNIQKEQVPSSSEMERQLGNFIAGEIMDCVFDSYYEQGFEISYDKPNVDVNIEKNSVRVNLKMNLNITKGDDTVLVRDHEIKVNSKLGSLYESARKIYDYEQNNLFLEEYAIDNLRLYAPVDGVELTCSPLIWKADNIFEDLKNAIEQNTLSLKLKGGDYSLLSKEDKYFVIDLDVGSNARFLTSKNWPSSFEVTPAEGSILLSNPIGNQKGLGILGFCYVPYHFVYSIKYPVLVQVYEGEEVFQFPVAVVIEGNNPRQALKSNAVEVESPGICEHKNTEVEVRVYDLKYNPLDAEISFECFGERCSIGKAKEGVLVSEFPQCVNGYIIAEADGFAKSKSLFSTVSSNISEIFLDKLYDVDIDLKLDGADYKKGAVIVFVSDDFSKTIVYPDTSSVELKQGQYEVQVYVYRNSSINLEGSSMKQCLEVPREGLGGWFGLTDEKCFDVEIPPQIISNALAGGGRQNHYILESDLENAEVIEINAQSLPTPKSLEQLQENYILFENKGLDIYFR